MVKALGSVHQAMTVQRLHHELIANNLANVNTPGFKRLIARVQALPAAATASGAAAPYGAARSLAVESVPVDEAGSLVATGSPLDAALVGEGYFLVETPQGQRLSRDGGFRLGAGGELLHASGNPVLVDGGPITLTGAPTILPDGGVLDGDRLAGRLSVMRPAEGATLTRLGDNLFAVEGDMEEVPADQVRVVGGHIEGSNVQAIQEMVDMIRAFRAYEIMQRAAQAADETLATATEKVGTVRA